MKRTPELQAEIGRQQEVSLARQHALAERIRQEGMEGITDETVEELVYTLAHETSPLMQELVDLVREERRIYALSAALED